MVDLSSLQTLPADFDCAAMWLIDEKVPQSAFPVGTLEVECKMGVCSRARLQPSELAPAIVDSVATGPDATRDRPNNKLLKRVLKREDSDADVTDEDWV